jgi:hypothetical protein
MYLDSIVILRTVRLVTWIVDLAVMQALGSCVLLLTESIFLIWPTVFHKIINHVFLILGLSVILSPTNPNYFAILIIYLQFVLVTMDTALTVFHKAGTLQ